MAKTPTKKQQTDNLAFKARLTYAKHKSNDLQRTFKIPTTTSADLEYWFLFVYANYLTGQRRQQAAQSYNVARKIIDMKKDGSWPPNPTHNQNMIGLFLRAYPEFQLTHHRTRT